MTKLYLIRHCETKFTQEKKYYGRLNIPITEKGKKQASDLKLKFEKIEIDKIYCSPLKRTIETTEIVFKNRQNEIIKNDNLIELNVGSWEGLSLEEICERDKKYYFKWLKNPHKYKIPNGESFSDIAERVLKFFDEVASLNKNIAVISHAGVIKVMVSEILQISPEKFWNFEIGTASVSVVEFFDKMPIIRSLNDRTHLKNRDLCT